MFFQYGNVNTGLPPCKTCPVISITLPLVYGSRRQARVFGGYCWLIRPVNNTLLVYAHVCIYIYTVHTDIYIYIYYVSLRVCAWSWLGKVRISGLMDEWMDGRKDALRIFGIAIGKAYVRLGQDIE